jgi:hypothetical protein
MVTSAHHEEVRVSADGHASAAPSSAAAAAVDRHAGTYLTHLPMSNSFVSVHSVIDHLTRMAYIFCRVKRT